MYDALTGDFIEQTPCLHMTLSFEWVIKQKIIQPTTFCELVLLIRTELSGFSCFYCQSWQGLALVLLSKMLLYCKRCI